MKIFILIALTLCLSTGAFADVKIVQKVKTSAVMGKPAKDGNMTMFIKGNKARIEHAATSGYQIVNLDEKKFYMVDPQKSICSMTTTDQLKQAAGMVGQLTGGQQSKPEVQKLGTKHTYNGYTCEDVKSSMSSQMISFTSVSCISPEIDTKEFDLFKEFAEDFARSFGIDPRAGLQGFPVHSETEMTMMGQKINSTTDMISISHDTLEASLFQIPADLKCNEMKMPAMKHP